MLASALLSIFILGETTSDSMWLALIFIAAFVLPLVATLLYCGLLSVVVAFLVNQAINSSPLTLQPSMPYGMPRCWPMLIVAGLAAFGVYASRGGQPLFGRPLRGE